MRDARHNQLLAIPAALYAVNNYLKFAMQLYFKPTTAKMLGNLKVGLLWFPFLSLEPGLSTRRPVTSSSAAMLSQMRAYVQSSWSLL